MRNMSFALTTPQIRARTKSVTRRLGWMDLRPRTELQAIVKGQGLKKGEHPEKICVIRVKSVRREPLMAMLEGSTYGAVEVVKEGFPNMTPRQFVETFCDHHGVTYDKPITRIEFEYVD